MALNHVYRFFKTKQKGAGKHLSPKTFQEKVHWHTGKKHPCTLTITGIKSGWYWTKQYLYTALGYRILDEILRIEKRRWFQITKITVMVKQAKTAEIARNYNGQTRFKQVLLILLVKYWYFEIFIVVNRPYFVPHIIPYIL